MSIKLRIRRLQRLNGSHEQIASLRARLHAQSSRGAVLATGAIRDASGRIIAPAQPTYTPRPTGPWDNNVAA